jgi:hypothetical protein
MVMINSKCGDVNDGRMKDAVGNLGFCGTGSLLWTALF